MHKTSKPLTGRTNKQLTIKLRKAKLKKITMAENSRTGDFTT